MLNLPPSTSANERARHFLSNYPAISQSLFEECGQDFDKISTFVEPILDAPNRCVTSFYIQAATTGRTAFLTTNLSNADEARVTAIASTWLIGRSRNCAITVAHRSVSRCHAVIGHVANHGFYIMDVGSSNGTWVNGRRLPILERQTLRDGDLVKLSHISVEFFVVAARQDDLRSQATQVQLES
jgi:FHA domain